MIYNLTLILASQPEVLERVLRVTRHRGFKVNNLQMQLDENGSAQLTMVVESERAVELLSHQLSKLIDVIECQTSTFESVTHTAHA